MFFCFLGGIIAGKTCLCSAAAKHNVALAAALKGQQYYFVVLCLHPLLDTGNILFVCLPDVKLLSETCLLSSVIFVRHHTSAHSNSLNLQQLCI